MNNLSRVYKQFDREVDEARDQINKIHAMYKNCVNCELIFTKPYTFFDRRVIPSERQNTKYSRESDSSCLDNVFKVFELSIYSLINREDEIIFDLGIINLPELNDRLFIAEHLTI